MSLGSSDLIFAMRNITSNKRMTRLEQQLLLFTKNGLTEEERQQVLNGTGVPITFKRIAKEFLCGCFIVESKERQVRIHPTVVEFYYHEEQGEIKDSIVYHRNNARHPERPLLGVGMLHNHYSGIDLAFEFTDSAGCVCRASTLVRAFRVIDGQSDDVLEIACPDARSTYFPKALLGQFSLFDGFSIRWSDTEMHAEVEDVFASRRVGMERKSKDTSGEAQAEAGRCWNFRLMMKDEYTNVVYLSEWLNDEKEGHPEFFRRLVDTLSANGVRHKILSKEQTKDYWVRDFMPIQLSDGEFVKYKYNPDYLRNRAEYKGLITNCTQACHAWNLKYKETSIVIDGGNVILCGDCIVMTDKVFAENGREKTDEAFKTELSKAFGGRRIVFIPWASPGTDDPDSGLDVYGHADGFVRYAGGRRILMSAHRMQHEEETSAIVDVLTRNGFEVTEMDFSAIGHDELDFDLNWAYLNFLQVGHKIFMPVFDGLKENDIARSYIQDAFPCCEIIPVEMGEIAKEGGALHCITWNIRE